MRKVDWRSMTMLAMNGELEALREAGLELPRLGGVALSLVGCCQIRPASSAVAGPLNRAIALQMECYSHPASTRSLLITDLSDLTAL